MSGDDAELVALIDNELDEEAKSRLLARLAGDEGLRARHDALRNTGTPIAAALDALVERAPLPRLRAALPPPPRAPWASRWPLSGIAFRDLAAGIVIGLLAAGCAIWATIVGLPLNVDRDNWQSAVAEYMGLYTNETFAYANPDQAFQAKKLSAVGEKVGLDLTALDVALPGLRYKSAHVLSYEGAPLVEIAFVDDRGSPVLFCIIANGAADAPINSERRGVLSLASWTRGGRGFLVIGRMPEEQAVALAQTLKKRV